MRLQFLKEEPLLTLKENITANYQNYFSVTNDWIADACGNDSPFSDFKIEVADFELFIDSDKPEETDLENIRRIYTNMKHLTETQASDERLWSGLEHGQFWNYMQYRWHSHNRKSTAENIKSRFFFAQDKRRSLFVNTLSKLWWIGKLVYDEHRSDPFELLDFFKTDFSTKALIMFSRNYTNNPAITRAVLRIFKQCQDQGHIVSRTVWLEVMKYVNMLGGAYVLDCFTEDELVEKIMTKMSALLPTTQQITVEDGLVDNKLDEIKQLRLIKTDAIVCPRCKSDFESKYCKIAIYTNKATQSGFIESTTPYCGKCNRYFIKNEQLSRLNKQAYPAHIKTGE